MSCGPRQKAWEIIGIHWKSLEFLAFCAPGRRDRLRTVRDKVRTVRDALRPGRNKVTEVPG